MKIHLDNKGQQPLTFVDLFCGCGGLSLGFEKQGFQLLLANDIDKDSIETFLKNRPLLDSNRVYCEDIYKVLMEQKDYLSGLNCDLVVGGPPCQGFSIANRQRLINDPRNILYKRFIEAVSLIKPKIFLMENVKGMLGVSSQVIEDFEKIGYAVKCKVFNVKVYGIPQNRERILYFGVSKQKIKHASMLCDKIIENVLNEKSTKVIPLKDALWGLRKLSAKRIKNATEIESKNHGFAKDLLTKPIEQAPPYIKKINDRWIKGVVYNHVARYNNDRDIEIFKRLPPGGKSDHPSIEDIMPYKNRSSIFKDKYYKLKPEEPCKTITSHMKFDCNMYIHPTQARGLTPREAARVQGFPDTYRFYGSFTRQYMQCGNSVPPLFAELIAGVIKRTLRECDGK